VLYALVFKLSLFECSVNLSCGRRTVQLPTFKNKPLHPCNRLQTCTDLYSCTGFFIQIYECWQLLSFKGRVLNAVRPTVLSYRGSAGWKLRGTLFYSQPPTTLSKHYPHKLWAIVCLLSSIHHADWQYHCMYQPFKNTVHLVDTHTTLSKSSATCQSLPVGLSVIQIPEPWDSFDPALFRVVNDDKWNYKIVSISDIYTNYSTPPLCISSIVIVHQLQHPSEMTYNVSMGTLNPTIPYHTLPRPSPLYFINCISATAGYPNVIPFILELCSA